MLIKPEGDTNTFVPER